MLHHVISTWGIQLINIYLMYGLDNTLDKLLRFFYKFNSWPDLILMVGVDRLDFRPSKYVPK